MAHIYSGEEIASWMKTLPTKRVSGKMVCKHPDGRVLFVKPTYRNEWQLPGGIVEAAESPLVGALRELMEETGLHIEEARVRFEGVNFSPPSKIYMDFIHLFFGAELTAAEVDSIELRDGELESYKFLTMEEVEAGGYVSEYWLPMEKALIDNEDAVYTEYDKAIY